MKIFQSLFIGVLLLFLSLPFSQPAISDDSKICPGAQVSSTIPEQLIIKSTNKDHRKKQNQFDCFSWQSLVALNWAAGNTNGTVDENIPFGQTGRNGLVVWETFKQNTSVFTKDGKDPCDQKSLEDCWNEPNQQEQIDMTSKVGGFAQVRGEGQVQAVPNAWLTDQKGNLLRYEIRLNKPEFEYIIKNGLHNKPGQIKFNAVNNDNREPTNPIYNPDRYRYTKYKRPGINMPIGKDNSQGAIELKAAWRILDDNEYKTSGNKYLTREISIHDTRINKDNGYPDPKNGVYMTCNKEGEVEKGKCVRHVGLVGFHIAHKVNVIFEKEGEPKFKPNGEPNVEIFPQWIWSTFEHINNAPDSLKGNINTDKNVEYNFFNKDCSERQCQASHINENPRKIPISVATPNQITRVLDFDQEDKDILGARAVSEEWHKAKAVENTVWKNYELIGTQWQNLEGKIIPKYLANITMETYIQDVGNVNELNGKGSSCIECHNLGSTLKGDGADFSYLFSKAARELGNNQLSGVANK